jgi:hypothetical protein
MQRVGCDVRLMTMKVLMAPQASKNGAAPLLWLPTRISAGPLPGISPAIASHNKERPAMAHTTRVSGLADSGTPASAVKITPAHQSGAPVPTTHGRQ